MPLLHNELFSFQGWHGVPSRCRVRVFTPPEEARESGYVILLTDDAQAQGTSITNAAAAIAALVCGRYHVPPERIVFLEHYDFRHLPVRCNGRGDAETFARVQFSVPQEAAARFAFIHGTSLGKPTWRHIDRGSVEILIGEPRP